MHIAEVSAADSAAGLKVPVWRVVKVHALPGYRLALQFADGTQGEVRMERLIHADDAGVFAMLRDERVFDAVHVEHGAVTWSDRVDLAPEALYDVVRQGHAELG
jgi:hypothetical protein